eukprot:scaffold10856_cov229-Amphora_coffeaeformis.AAC.22
MDTNWPKESGDKDLWHTNFRARTKDNNHRSAATKRVHQNETKQGQERRKIASYYIQYLILDHGAARRVDCDT